MKASKPASGKGISGERDKLAAMKSAPKGKMRAMPIPMAKPFGKKKPPMV